MFTVTRPVRRWYLVTTALIGTLCMYAPFEYDEWVMYGGQRSRLRGVHHPIRKGWGRP